MKRVRNQTLGPLLTTRSSSMALAKMDMGWGRECRAENGQKWGWEVRLASERASLTVVCSPSYIWPRTFYLLPAGTTFITFPESNHFWPLPWLSMATTLAQVTIISHVIHSNVVLTDLYFYLHSFRVYF